MFHASLPMSMISRTVRTPSSGDGGSYEGALSAAVSLPSGNPCLRASLFAEAGLLILLTLRPKLGVWMILDGQALL